MNNSPINPPDPSAEHTAAKVRPAGWRNLKERHCCNFCQHFNCHAMDHTGRCPKVRASVRAADVCDLFETKEQRPPKRRRGQR